MWKGGRGGGGAAEPHLRERETQQPDISPFAVYIIVGATEIDIRLAHCC